MSQKFFFEVKEKTGSPPIFAGSGGRDESAKNWFLILDSCKKLEFWPQWAPKTFSVLKSDYVINYGVLEYQKKY